METLKILTNRFGEIEAAADRVITMEKPVLGFEGHREFIVVETDDLAPFAWLQSLSDPELAFLVVNPALFFPDYLIEVNRREVADIEAGDNSALEIFVIVTIGASADETTVNLQGPIVINTDSRKAKQLVLANSDYSVRQTLQQRMPAGETSEISSPHASARV